MGFVLFYDNSMSGSCIASSFCFGVDVKSRPKIPAEIKRVVRKRCGFGCVICGSPIYEYDHIVEWSKTHSHRAEEITLLCNRHHGEKTKKILPVERVIVANNNPFNKNRRFSAPQSLYYDGGEFRLKLGDSISTYSGLKEGETFAPFAIDGQPVISFTNDQGDILLNFDFKDERGNTILLVENSELILSVGFWDIEWIGQKLTLRESERSVLLELVLSPPGMVSIDRGFLQYNGVEIEIGDDFIFCLNNQSFLHDCEVKNFGYGFVLGEPIPDGPCGVIFSSLARPVRDRDAARRFMKASLKKMRSKKKYEKIEGEIIEPSTTRGKLRSGVAPICNYFN